MYHLFQVKFLRHKDSMYHAKLYICAQGSKIMIHKFEQTDLDF